MNTVDDKRVREIVGQIDFIRYVSCMDLAQKFLSKGLATIQEPMQELSKAEDLNLVVDCLSTACAAAFAAIRELEPSSPRVADFSYGFRREIEALLKVAERE